MSRGLHSQGWWVGVALALAGLSACDRVTHPLGRVAADPLASSGSAAVPASEAGTTMSTGGEQEADAAAAGSTEDPQGGSVVEVEGTSGGQPVVQTVCATTDAALETLTLVLVIDTSFNLAVDTNLGLTEIWDPISNGIASFAEDERSTGLFSALFYLNMSCDPNDYAVPNVPLQRLPSPEGAFYVTLPSVNLVDPDGVVSSALNFARAIKERALPTEEAAVVLLTDGVVTLTGTHCDPASDSLVTLVNDEFRNADTPVSTYVLQLAPWSPAGPTGEDLAAAGSDAGVLYTFDYTQYPRNVLNETLHQIRADLQPCHIKLPATTSGEDVVVEMENIGQLELLTDAEACSDQGGAAIHGYYEVVSGEGAKKLELCPRSCERVRSLGARIVELTGPCEEVSVR